MGAFNNYVDRILPMFDPPPPPPPPPYPCVDSFYTLSVDKNRHNLTSSLPSSLPVLITIVFFFVHVTF